MSRPRTSSIRTVTPTASLVGRLRDLLRYRELLVNLVRMELRSKYKSSALGFAWSLLNPVMYLVVFTVAFDLILNAAVPRYPIYILSGLLVWNFFTSALMAGTYSIVNNAGLVNKVWFPREILPLAAVGAALVHFFLQTTVLAAALVVFRHPVDWQYVVLLPIGLLALVQLAAALTLLLSAANVYLRDVAHFVELAILAWFWVTPIIYPFTQLTEALGGRAWPALLNPVTPIVLGFQRAFYGVFGEAPVIRASLDFGWYCRNLLIVGAASGLLLLVALRVFRRLEANFAEEL